MQKLKFRLIWSRLWSVWSCLTFWLLIALQHSMLGCLTNHNVKWPSRLQRRNQLSGTKEIKVSKQILSNNIAPFQFHLIYYIVKVVRWYWKSGLDYTQQFLFSDLQYYRQRDRNIVYVKIKKNHLWSLHRTLENCCQFFFSSVAKRPFLTETTRF